MTIKTKPFLLFLLLLNFHAKAQKTVTNQSLYWLRYYNQFTINKKWTWINEMDDRRFFKNSRQHHLIFHSHLQYKFFHSSDAAFGLTYSLQSPQELNSTSKIGCTRIKTFSRN